MSKNKRINPSRKPATQADIKRAKKEAIAYAWAIMFTVMRDKFGYGPIRLQRMWSEVNKLSDEITEGYVSLNDLMRTLETEAGIILVRGNHSNNTEVTP